jgi:hypothetical protein
MGRNPGLRPLEFGEILDVSLKLVARHWRRLAICVLVVIVPVQILTVVVIASVAPDQLDLTSADATPLQDDDGNLVLSLVAVRILELLTYAAAVAACFRAVGDGYLGREPEVGRSLRFGLPQVPRLIGLYIVVSVCGAIGLVLLIVPGVWLLTVWSLALPVMLFERIGMFTALGRSYELVRGRFWGVLGLLVVSALLVAVAGLVLGGVLGGLTALAAGSSKVAGAIATLLIGVVSNLVAVPVLAAVLSVLYFDQRVRKEGFDIARLADGLGGEPGSPPAPPAAPPSDYSGWQPPRPPQPGAERTT